MSPPRRSRSSRSAAGQRPLHPSAPAVGGPNDLDQLLHPPPAEPHRPGRVRAYTLVATDRDVEIAPGITFPAWTYNGTVPGPVIRATEGGLEVVVEVGRFVARRAAGGLGSGYVIAGFLAGIVVMYATGLLAA